MQEKQFEEVFDMSIFQENTIVIDEDTSQNCDFFILELVKAFNYTIFQWNDSGEFLKSSLGKYNAQATIKSVYTSEFNSEDIIDDIYTQRKLGYCHISKVNVFRASTATARDFYDYDIVVKIYKLRSGCSSKIDGSIKVFRRDKIYYDLKYKVFSDRIVYFE
ncbi:uncharacterized protein VICG_00549 [Vittaforma corneae ATCC 50505]|uniref:Uncharacterized protein n=1 Tax=Vittaforma corneae (strain ATCC 50505) TaxID=993615 RepID=L2GPL3_VITCO|nr:uncharacterized protein VICG_00549 [Vittaforma corneae ATCC 50505]ELA42450.1 hypothetical protein VICG_00549 [Vittaforma corneae ATCC 50505]